MRPEIDIERIARLARFNLTTLEATQLKSELEAVIELAEKLSELPELKSRDERAGVLREDIPEKCLSVEELLSNAPKTSQSCFVAPRTVQGD